MHDQRVWRVICFPEATSYNIYMSRKSAFTLIELMLVVAILVDLAVIALPAFLRSRIQAQNAKFISDLRTAAGAFEMYAAENNTYPPDGTAGVVPPGMSQYLKGVDWQNVNSISGNWKWMLNEYSTTAQVGVILTSPASDINMADIDRRIDDGVLSTGSFRKQTTTIYTYTIER
jgi:prepilin-type N-terminal cleavage/methylation domain-containing protein